MRSILEVVVYWNIFVYFSVSGEVPSGDAVVSRSSGLLFDKKLLLSKFTCMSRNIYFTIWCKFIDNQIIFHFKADNGPDYYSCPITHTTLSVHEDLINVKGKM